MNFRKRCLNWKVVGWLLFLALPSWFAGWMWHRIESKKRHGVLEEVVGKYGGRVTYDKRGYEFEQWLAGRGFGRHHRASGKTGVRIFGKDIDLEGFLASAIGVEISGSPAINDEDLHTIVRIGTIRSLELPVSTLGDPQAEIVGQCRNLEYLDLTGVVLSDDGFSHLGNLRKLRGFTFSNNILSNRSCEVFLEMKRLSHLEIRRTSFTLEGLEFIVKEHRSLRKIIVSEGVLKNDDLAMLSEFNPDLEIILTPANGPFKSLGFETIFNSQK